MTIYSIFCTLVCQLGYKRQKSKNKQISISWLISKIELWFLFVKIHQSNDSLSFLTFISFSFFKFKEFRYLWMLLPLLTIKIFLSFYCCAIYELLFLVAKLLYNAKYLSLCMTSRVSKTFFREKRLSQPLIKIDDWIFLYIYS